jgi:chemotaxis signal transduction protein
MEPKETRHLCCRSGGHALALAADEVLQVVEAHQSARVPLTSELVTGLVVVRDRAIPVVTCHGTAAAADGKFVLLRRGFAVRVDDVVGLRRLQPDPDAAPADNLLREHLQPAKDEHGTAWQIVGAHSLAAALDGAPAKAGA